MVNYLKEKFALTDKGAKDLTKASIACALTDLSFMFPVGLLYMVLGSILERYTGMINMPIGVTSYILISIVILTAIYVFERFQYNSTFLAAYEESANKRINIAEKMRKIPLSFFGKRDLADLTTTIMQDCSGLETAFSHFIPELIGAIISVVFVAIGLFTFNVRLAASLLWVVPASFLIVILGKNKQNLGNEEKNEKKIICEDNIQECIENIREIKANNQEDKYMEALDKNLDILEHINLKTELNMAKFVVPSQLLLKVGIATMALMGAKLISSGSIDFLTFLMFLIAASRVFDPLSIAMENLVAIYSTEIKVGRMKEIEGQKIQKGNEVSDFEDYNITFDNVDFSYDGEEKILSDVSFVAKQGEVTALVGPSGGGKSTVSKLAARFWDVNKGTIKVGGKDISKIEPEELLKKYSIVFQDVVLFNNTVLENIRLGRRGATDEEVREAAKEACCDEFINNLPDGYNTMIGENGSSLSGGERQRISIARALLKDAPIVLLDEATASLDVENESKVQEAISRLVQNKTVLVIAHRMRTVAGADKIVVLKDGKVDEEGKHEELLREKGTYNRLWTLQTKAAEWSL